MRDKVKDRSILILLDIRSTITFINLKLVRDLRLEEIKTFGMIISLANGSRVFCNCIFSNVTSKISISIFSLDFKILELGTYNFVMRND